MNFKYFELNFLSAVMFSQVAVETFTLYEMQSIKPFENIRLLVTSPILLSSNSRLISGFRKSVISCLVIIADLNPSYTRTSSEGFLRIMTAGENVFQFKEKMILSAFKASSLL